MIGTVTAAQLLKAPAFDFVQGFVSELKFMKAFSKDGNVASHHGV